jgi:hypothetical protein
MIDPTRHDIESTVLEDQPWRQGFVRHETVRQ